MRFLLPLLLLLPTLALATDVKPSSVKLNNKCRTYSMCVNQTATGVCVAAGSSDVIVLSMGRVATYVFYSNLSTTASYTCNIMTNKKGYTYSDDNSTATDQVNTASITDDAPVYIMHVLLHKLWITCSERQAGGGIYIDVDVCPRD